MGLAQGLLSVRPLRTTMRLPQVCWNVGASHSRLLILRGGPEAMTGIGAATALALCVWLSTTMPLEGAAIWHSKNVLGPCQ